MRNYKLNEKYRIYSKSVSKGTQVKYRKDEYYYKVNKNGNEGFTEYLVSRLLVNSTLNPLTYTRYEYCKINDVLGCRSKSFMSDSEEFVSISRIYQKQTGYNNLSDYLYTFENAQERLNYILQLVSGVGFSKEIYRVYLNILVQLDLLICNTDRHTNNYGLIYNGSTNTFRLPPIFDNGLSLGTDGDMNPCSCTISGSFLEQVTTFSYPVVPMFKLNYSAIKGDLARIRDLYGDKKEIEFLKRQLEEYDYLFKC